MTRGAVRLNQAEQEFLARHLAQALEVCLQRAGLVSGIVTFLVTRRLC